MTITVSLGFSPIWSTFDLVGIAAGGAKLYSYDSLNPTSFKPIYQDAAMQNAYTNPILFNSNGNAPGAFYFTFDTDNEDSLYDLYLYDSSNNLIWSVYGYNPSTGGGSSVVTTYNNIENLVTNNAFYRNIGTSASPLPASLTIAPSNHEGLTVPDIVLFKNNTNATDQITFEEFNLGDDPLTGDVTPQYYLNYTCSNTPSGETYKYVQYPICAKVKNLENQPITISIWAEGVSGAQTLDIKVKQFYGTGAPVEENILDVQTLTLTSDWAKYSVQTTVPNTAGVVLGACGDDYLAVLIGFPLGESCEINYTKTSVYLGTVNPGLDFESYDHINMVIGSPRTGDIRTSLNNFSQFGWAPMNDGTIGGATSGATTRANLDTFPLYRTIWNNVSNTYAPVSGGRGGTAYLDFAANKTLALTKMLGRAFASAGTGSGLSARTLGQYLGEETHTLTTPEIPSHTHALPGYTGGKNDAGGSAGSLNVGTAVGTPVTDSAGGGGSHNNMQPTTFLNVFVKL